MKSSLKWLLVGVIGLFMASCNEDYSGHHHGDSHYDSDCGCTTYWNSTAQSWQYVPPPPVVTPTFTAIELYNHADAPATFSVNSVTLLVDAGYPVSIPYQGNSAQVSIAIGTQVWLFDSPLGGGNHGYSLTGSQSTGYTKSSWY